MLTPNKTPRLRFHHFVSSSRLPEVGELSSSDEMLFSLGVDGEVLVYVQSHF